MLVSVLRNHLAVIVISPQIQIPLTDFRFTFSRSSGPGGQNVNKVNSKVTLHWDVSQTQALPDDVRSRFQAKYRRRINADGQLVIYSQRYRDQLRNRDDCLEKLRHLIISVVAPPKRRRLTKPSRAARERRMREKRRTAEKKQLRRPPGGAV